MLETTTLWSCSSDSILVSHDLGRNVVLKHNSVRTYIARKGAAHILLVVVVFDGANHTLVHHLAFYLGLVQKLSFLPLGLV